MTMYRRELLSLGVFAVFFCESFQRRDVDNMLKLILDALNGVVWKDDAQVTEVSGRVARGVSNPRTAVLLYRINSAGSIPTKACEGGAPRGGRRLPRGPRTALSREGQDPLGPEEEPPEPEGTLRPLSYAVVTGSALVGLARLAWVCKWQRN